MGSHSSPHPFIKRRVLYVASERLAKVSSLLPSNRNRSVLVHSLITCLGLMRSTDRASVEVLRPPLATVRELCAYHDRDYVDQLLEPVSSSEHVATTVNSNKEFGLEDDCPPFRGMPEYVQLVAGASLAAARALAEGMFDVSICWDGGRHHAHKSHASGYCYVNDCVLALLLLKRAPPVTRSLNVDGGPRRPRIMYLDLDLHFSDAVSSAFHASSSSPSSSQLLTLSLHHAAPGFFPVSPLSCLPTPESDPFTLAVPLRSGASNATYMRLWVNVVERVRAAFQPDYVVVQCGTDALAEDPCKVGNWSLGGPGGLSWCVERVLSQWGAKVLLLGGGGYNSPNAARSWALITSVARGSPLPLDTPIPDHAGFPLYAPSFTLDVPAGGVRDENTSETLSELERAFDPIVESLRTALN
ncbi:Arginase/deacetylase [Auriscalpium vulgare]|uniref:Arginase/deacetylase n=1 Tax=Auriscalpium vulgare TaxID=40419 RepID=A0ACB8RNU4_9AGAM|nr:Arginase/deacetylase [Auriscalpium vulgare]